METSNKLDTKSVEDLVKGIKDSPLSRINGAFARKRSTNERVRKGRTRKPRVGLNDLTEDINTYKNGGKRIK